MLFTCTPLNTLPGHAELQRYRGVVRGVLLPLLCLVVASSFAEKTDPPGLAIDEIVELRGEPLVKAVDAAMNAGKSLLFDDLLRCLVALNGAPPPHNPLVENIYGEVYEKVFRAACGAASRENLDALVSVFRAAPSEQVSRRLLLFGIAPLWLEREFLAIENEKLDPIVPSIGAVTLPDDCRGLPEDVRSVWRYFSALMAPFEREYGWNEKSPWIGYSGNEDVFWEDAGAILAGETKEAFPRLALFRWGGFCGTGSEELYDPKSILMLMALVKERRLREGIGAVMGLPGRRGDTGEQWPEGRDIARRLLALCGIDWQEAFCGAMVRGTHPYWSIDFGYSLAVDGDDGIALTLSHGLSAGPSKEEKIAQTLDCMLRPPNPEGSVDHQSNARLGNDIPPPRAVALSDETREGMIEAFATWASTESDGYALTSAMPHLVSLHRPSTTAALRRLLEHHSPNLVAEATKELLARGEVIAKTEPAKPVTFRLMFGGGPVSSGSVDVRFHAERFSRKINVRPDFQGSITIPGEDLARRHSPVTAITFETDMGYNSQRELKDPCFRVTVPIRPNQKPPVVIAIPAQPVTLALQFPRSANVETGHTVRLRVAGQAGPDDESDIVSAEYFLPPRPPYLIPALQEGNYRFEVQAPGVGTWTSQVTAVKGAPKTINAVLARGRDVRVRLDFPKGAPLWLTPCRISNADGDSSEVMFDFETKEAIFTSLVPGSYTLSVLSSAELRQALFMEQGQSNEIVLKPREEAEWKGATKPFIIKDNSPNMVDLGTVRVEALPVQRKQPGSRMQGN